jgi:Zn-finger nucleic acid-binding protein
MKCPIDKETELSPHEPEPDLTAHKCKTCEGMWVTSDSYHSWTAKQPGNLPEKAADPDFNLSSDESLGMKMCPVCSFFLVRYRVGKGLDFSLNRCGQCAGIWFDKNEWEILKSRNLHDDVHFIFSHNWQAQIREEEHMQAMNKMWLDQFGAADLAEIQRIQKWLDGHEKSEQLYAYLMASKHQRLS